MIRLAQQAKIETILSCKVSIDLDCIYPHLVVLYHHHQRVYVLLKEPQEGAEHTCSPHLPPMGTRFFLVSKICDIIVLAYTCEMKPFRILPFWLTFYKLVLKI